MAAHGGSDRLRELHEDYVWRVNSAVGEGREDLVWQLVDDYTEAALRLMADEHGAGWLDCPTCDPTRRGSPAPSRDRRWRSLLRRFRTG